MSQIIWSNPVNRSHPGLWKDLSILWAPYLGSTGAMLRDVSGRKLGGDFEGGLSASDWTAGGKYGIGLDFNDSNLVRSSRLTPHVQQMSSWALIRYDTTGVAFSGVLAHHTTNGQASDWFMYIDNDDKIHIDIPWVLGDAAIADTALGTGLHTVGFTRTGTTGDWTYRFFLDGKSDGSGTTATNPNTSDHNFMIGGLPGVNTSLGGLVYAAASWNRVVPEETFRQLHVDPLAFFRRRRRVFKAPAVATTLVGGSIKRSTNAITWSNPVNRSHPLNKGLVSWHLNTPNSRGGTTFRDLQGKNHGTLTSMDPATDWVRGRPGSWGALDFTESGNEKVSISTSLVTGFPFSVGFWVKLKAATTEALLGFADTSQDGFYIGFFSVTSRGWEIQLRNGGGFDSTNFAVANGGSIDTEWHLLTAVSANSSEHKLYLDGDLLDTDTNSTGMASYDETAFAAIPDSGPSYGDCLLDDIRIYNRALNASEVTQLYNLSRTGYGDLLNRRRLVFAVPVVTTVPDWGYQSRITLPQRLRKNKYYIDTEEYFVTSVTIPDWGYELQAILPSRLIKQNRLIDVTGLVPIIPPNWGYELQPVTPPLGKRTQPFVEVEDFFLAPIASVPDFGYQTRIILPHKLRRTIREQLADGFVPILNPPVTVPDFVGQIQVLPQRRRKLNRGRVVVTDITEEILVQPGEDRLDGQYLVQYPTPYTGQIAQAGQYIGTYNPSSSTMVLSNTIVYFVPLVITYPVTIDRLGVYVTVPQSSKFCRVALYRSELGIPGDKIADTGNIVVGTIGERTGAVSVRLSEGVYLCAFGTNATTAEVRISDVRASVLPELSGSNTAINSFYSESFSGGFKEFNTTPTTLTLTGGSVPRIFARRQL